MARAPSVLFVNQHYHPDVASTGQHLTDLAEHLARQGFAVEVLTSRGRYLAGKVAAPAHEVRNGVGITRVRGTSFGRRTHAGRLLDYASFYVRALGAIFRRRHDGVVFLTTPPLLPVAGAVARALRGQRYAIWSMDLHPDAEIASGMLSRNSIAARVLRRLNAWSYRRADRVVDLGEYMKSRIIGYGVDRARTRTVHVWSAREEIEPTPRDENPVRRELGLGDRFVVMYSGNAGLVHDFRDILEAMRRLREDPRIYFLFVGGGPRRGEIEAFAATHSLKNFTYRDYFPREQLKHSLAVADAHLISLRAPFVGISVPGKLYGIMAAGRPALFVGPERCESADTIRAARCGAVVDPASEVDAAESIVKQLRAWCERTSDVDALGANGRAAFLERYERAPNCAAFEAVLREAWQAENAASQATVA